MAAESDTPMGGQHPDIDSHPEERAAKRIKIDDAAPTQDHNEENGQDTPHDVQNGNHIEPSDNNQAQPASETSKPSNENGKSDDRDRVKGLAPIKKE
jgi:tRNA-dihydrouridine synthase 3